MRLSRIIMALAAGLAVAAVPTAAGAAQPQPYPPPVADLTVTPPAIVIGGTFTLNGSGFDPGEPVTIDVTITDLTAAAPALGTARRSDGTTVAMASVAYPQQPGPPQPAPLHFTVTADATGSFTVPYRPTQVGRYTFTATGQTSHRVASAMGTVLPRHKPKPREPHGHLPVTGSAISTPMKIGGGVAGTGALLVLLSLAWRRRDRLGLGSR